MAESPIIQRLPVDGSGRTLAVRRWPALDDGGGKPPVVCVHGLLRLARDFDALAVDLSRDREVWAVDMAGRGDSDWLTDPAGYGYPTYVADCLAVMAALRAETGWRAIDWVGTSMGGLIALTLPPAMAAAGDGLPALRRVVLNDIGAVVPGTALARILDYAAVPPPIFPGRAAAEAHLRTLYAPFAPPDEAAWAALIGSSLRRTHDGWTLHYDPAIATALAAQRPENGEVADVDLRGFWTSFPAETLILRGEESDVLTAEIADEMVATAAHPASSQTIRGVGHAPMLVRAEEIASVRRFLDDGGPR